MVRIPTTFKIANRTWKVTRRKMRHDYGSCNMGKATISLSSDIERGSELELHTFVHELLHAAAGTMGWKRVDDDETRLDALAGMLAHALQSAQYEDKET